MPTPTTNPNPNPTTNPNPNLSQQGQARLDSLGLRPEQLPRHVAIIMDGNGRWAERQGMPRILGHRRGIRSVRAVVEEGCRLGLQQLTLYCLSVENWKRPPRELKFLLRLLRHFLNVERDELMEQNVRLTMIGRREGLPADVLDEYQRTAERTANNHGMTLCLAINYSGRSEIVDAVRQIAEQARDGRLDPASIDESIVSEHLYTAGMADPDLLIRTAGELRVSNYLLWQISYAELFVTDVLWPDFRAEHLQAAMIDFARRQRKFGGLAGDDES
ncbi:isoprenyl transferase [soil metagenome]